MIIQETVDIKRRLEMKDEEASKLNLNELKEEMKIHEDRAIDKLIIMSKSIDPYTMDFIRDPSSSWYLEMLLYKICHNLREYQIYKSYLLNTKQPYILKLDVRGLIPKIGIELYGRLFKFLEETTIRFIDNPNVLVIDKLKYNSFNSNEFVRNSAIKEKEEKENNKVKA